MRKLWEADKLSSNWNHQRLRCLRFPIKGDDSSTQLNWHDLDRYYHLEASSEAMIRPEEFCDRIIHSFIFSPSIGNEDAITAFYFTSDTMRHRSVRLIGLDVVANLMTTTGKYYPSTGYGEQTANLIHGPVTENRHSVGRSPSEERRAPRGQALKHEPDRDWKKCPGVLLFLAKSCT
jgi:hypothetical protein